MKNNKAFTLAELLVVVSIFGILAAIVIGRVGFSSEGVRSGTVIKLSCRGVFFKTWEGDLLAGTQGVVAGAEKFSFSVEDKEVVEDLFLAIEKSKPVILKYKEVGIWNPMRGNTHYFIQSVKRME